ncbi:MAG: late competence development ComFB family protein [Oscillospiraceae bacterium]|nr:late competence development ComFB family protein [Oscillospiraceae bacterium]
MALINVTEQIVEKRMQEILPTIDCCKCEKCYLDMMAIALNYLKPQYVNTEKGQLIKLAENTSIQKTVDIDIACVKAIDIVSRSPQH